MRIVFIHTGIEFDGASLEQGPLGGTETALISMAKALAKNPEHEIFVFTNTPQTADYDGVHYLPVRNLYVWSASHSVDVLISIRQWIPFWLPIKSRLRVYFSPDAYDQPFLKRAIEVGLDVHGEKITLSLFPPQDFFNSIDYFFCVGKWQAETFVSGLGFPRAKIFVTGNAVNTTFFKPLELAHRKNRIMYTSTPFRGLEYLARYYPKLKVRAPDVGLDVFSGMQLYGMTDKDDQEQYGTLYEALKNAGACLHGPVRQQQLAKVMCANRVLTYPNTFAETFCISVLEAQAAGLPVVTSKKGAMPERITNGVDGFLIAGEPHEESYEREFIQITAKLLQDETLWKQISSDAHKKAATQTYEGLAENWLEFFNEALNIRHEAVAPLMPCLKPLEVHLPQKKNIRLKIEETTLRHFLRQGFQLYGFSF
ncbi:MAG: glycosyltransferase family 4 protein [Deltaproteobacteria bacterium]|nr:glycosyltransferase family 4 protein [Deltaproteobacteria bacterium]